MPGAEPLNIAYYCTGHGKMVARHHADRCSTRPCRMLCRYLGKLLLQGLDTPPGPWKYAGSSAALGTLVMTSLFCDPTSPADGEIKFRALVPDQGQVVKGAYCFPAHCSNRSDWRTGCGVLERGAYRLLNPQTGSARHWRPAEGKFKKQRPIA